MKGLRKRVADVLQHSTSTTEAERQYNYLRHAMMNEQGRSVTTIESIKEVAHALIRDFNLLFSDASMTNILRYRWL